MKNRIISLIISLLLLLCCGCDAVTSVKGPTASKGNTQVVLAMNPSVITADGQVMQMSKDISSNMSIDVSSGSAPTLYENTSWRWLYTNEDGYTQRAIRELESFKDNSGKTAKGVPYAYTVTDDRASSISIFDSNQMKLETYKNDILPQNGILFTFNSNKTEALVYILKEDGKFSFADPTDSKITLIKGVSTIDTDVLSSKNSFGVLLKVYVNGCVIWQDILGNSALLGEEKTSLDFPEIPAIDLKAGDCFILSAEIISDSKDIKTGYFEIPDATTLRKKAIKVAKEVEVENSPADSTLSGDDIPLITQSGEFKFTVIRPDSPTDETRKIINNFVSDLQTSLVTTVKYVAESDAKDYDHRIFVLAENFEASKLALEEIKNYRSNNVCDFIIRTVGNDVVISALNDLSLQMALDYFIDTYCADDKYTVPKNLNYISALANSIKNMKIANNNISEYTIVVPQTASYIERIAAEWLSEQLIFTTGVQLNVVDDKTAVASKEIVLGITNRTKSNYLLSGSTKSESTFDYSISVENGKLYITGSSAAVSAGCKELINLIMADAKFDNGYKKNGKYDGGYTLVGGYKLMVADEFNGNELSNIWRIRSSLAEAEYGGATKILDSCSYLENGTLVQHAYTDGTNRYGGRISTQGAVSWKYGYCEIRVKYATTPKVCLGFCCYGFTSVEGSGLIEYDIVENLGGKYNLDHTIHHWQPHYFVGNKNNYIYKEDGVTPEQWGEKFHTIGFEWDTTELKTYIDGKPTITIDLTDPKYEAFDYPCSAELCTQFYQELANDPGADFIEDFSYVDYFRIYQKADNDSGISMTAIYQ